MNRQLAAATFLLAGVSVTSLALNVRLLHRQRNHNGFLRSRQSDDGDADNNVHIDSNEGGISELCRPDNPDARAGQIPAQQVTPADNVNQGNTTSKENPTTSTTLPSTNNDKGKLDENDGNTSNSRRIRPTLEQHMANNHGGALMVQPIGVVRSIYRLCVGTPRQGLLAPHARGRIELSGDQHVAQDSISGLEGFSHIWIVFVFHLNLLPNAMTKLDDNKKSAAFKVPAKIAPPALGGTKVGVLATRSPHRFNPIGITLAKLDRIEIIPKHDQRAKAGGSRVWLHISGLDLVDGTPVVDIKPFVPTYDSVPAEADKVSQPIGGNDHSSQNHSIHQNNMQSNNGSVHLPPWVSNGLATRRPVTISEQARQELATIIVPSDDVATNNGRRRPLEFYGQSDESPKKALDNILYCIQEVLSMDVRSSWQTNKARKGDFKAQRANRLQANEKQNEPPDEEDDNNSNSTMTCTQQLDNLLIHYTVTGASQVHRSSSQGSGAEDYVCVTSIQELAWQKGA